MIAFFPRTASLTLDDRNLSFNMADDTIEIEARFDLKKMLYKGALTL